MDIYEDLQYRGLIAQVTDEEKIRPLLNEGKATFYIGFDPTADSLHIGHFMAILLIKRLQMAGNKPIILLGGGTGHIGDPTQRTDMRPMMTKEEIMKNCDNFKDQIARFIDLDNALVVNNADWLLDLNYIDFLREIGPYFSVNTMLRAECYKQRMEKGLSFLEFNYMPMQSYDFYYLFKHYNCNMQFGGDDQWSNMLGGTELIRKKLGKDAYCMTINLLLNSDGKKMGKTSNGAIWLDENKTSPFEFYQYWRNVDDRDVIRFLKMLTFLSREEIAKYENLKNEDLNIAKEVLAYEVTKMVHGENKANEVRTTAKALFSNNLDSENMPSFNLYKSELKDNSVSLIDLLFMSKLVLSKSEARRLIMQNGISIDNRVITDINYKITLAELSTDIVLKKGKKNYLKIILKD